LKDLEEMDVDNWPETKVMGYGFMSCGNCVNGLGLNFLFEVFDNDVHSLFSSGFT